MERLMVNPDRASLIRSFAAVFGSYVLSMLCFTGIAVVSAAAYFQSPRMVGSIAAAVAGVIGGWLAAGLSGRAPLMHAVALAGLILGVFAFSAASPAARSETFDGISMAVMLLMAITGGWLQTFSSTLVNRLVIGLCLAGVAALVIFLAFFYRPTVELGGLLA
jgi:hypothetical protein